MAFKFQSTRSSRSGTPGVMIFVPEYLFQSTRSSRSGTSGVHVGDNVNVISIHPLLAERDRRTESHVHRIQISIHPLLAERD